MPRGRHRHSPPLHRLLPPSAIAGVSLVCAVGPWLFTEPAVLRVLAAGAAVTAVAGAVVMRRWDTAAGKRVADLTRARASDEWRHDERVAELETDLDESRELRVKLEHKLRAKRTELAGLRNEHAALLRRYATAETERATALEGRRQLAIEASVPTRALPAARTAPDETAVPEPVDPAGFFGVAEAPDAEDERERSAEAGAAPQADGADPATGTRDDTKDTTDTTDTTDSTTPEDAEDGGTAAGDDAPSEDTGTAGSAADTDTDTGTGTDAEAGATADADTTGEVFSPAGSGLFLRAGAALNRISSGGPQKESAETAAPGAVAVAEPDSDTDPDADPDPDAAPDTDADAEGGADPAQATTSQGAEPGESALDAAVKDAAARKSAAARQRTTGPKAGTTNTEPPKGASRGGAATPSDAGPSAGPDPSSGAGVEDGGAQGKPEAVGGHQRAAAEAKPSPSRPAPGPPRPAPPLRRYRTPCRLRRPGSTTPSRPPSPRSGPGTSPFRPPWPSSRPPRRCDAPRSRAGSTSSVRRRRPPTPPRWRPCRTRTWPTSSARRRSPCTRRRRSPGSRPRARVRSGPARSST